MNNNNQHPEYIRGTMAGMAIMAAIALLLHWLAGDAFGWATGILTVIMLIGYLYETDRIKPEIEVCLECKKETHVYNMARPSGMCIYCYEKFDRIQKHGKDKRKNGDNY
jgi:hypothetical protein